MEEAIEIEGRITAVLAGTMFRAKLDNGLFIYPFLGRLVGAAEPAALAVEATTDGSEVSRGSFVGPIRNDGTLRDHVATGAVYDIPVRTFETRNVKIFSVGGHGHAIATAGQSLLPQRFLALEIEAV